MSRAVLGRGVRWGAVALWLGGMGCARPAAPEAAAEVLDPVATQGVDDPALARLLDRHWRWSLAAYPEAATWYGMPGFDDRMTDPSDLAEADRHATLQSLGMAAEALDPSGWSDGDRLAHQQLRRVVGDGLQEATCRGSRWVLSIRDNPLSDLFGVLSVQDLSTEEALAVAAARVRHASQTLTTRIALLEDGAQTGWVANRRSVEVVLAQVDEVLATPTAAWAPVAEVPDGVSPNALVAALDDTYRPVLARFRDALQTTILPAARADDAPGLASLPGGEACYAARVQRYTTDPSLTPMALHETGLQELERIHAEMGAVAARVFGPELLSDGLDRLRTDPSLRFESGEEILAAARDALARAEAAVPAVFDTLPATPCTVEPVPAHEAPYTTVAYYRPPAADGSRPGTYVVNTHDPTSRTRFEAEALAFHEAVPGHHLQIARQQELSARPAILRFEGATVSVEGWALYAEGLAVELGLYKDDLALLGRHSFDAWRAARLVVDTGLHHLGWSRDEAIAFLRDHTALAETNVVNEVDRYIAWPGQALADKTGELAIRRLRAQAEDQLGARFDLAGFHEAVLGAGALSLPALEARVQAWIGTVQAGAPTDDGNHDG